jgi:hypothetical protein
MGEGFSHPRRSRFLEAGRSGDLPEHGASQRMGCDAHHPNITYPNAYLRRRTRQKTIDDPGF